MTQEFTYRTLLSSFVHEKKQGKERKEIMKEGMKDGWHGVESGIASMNY